MLLKLRISSSLYRNDSKHATRLLKERRFVASPIPIALKHRSNRTSTTNMPHVTFATAADPHGVHTMFDNFRELVVQRAVASGIPEASVRDFMTENSRVFDTALDTLAELFELPRVIDFGTSPMHQQDYFQNGSNGQTNGDNGYDGTEGD